jgi:hypothetical protein
MDAKICIIHTRILTDSGRKENRKQALSIYDKTRMKTGQYKKILTYIFKTTYSVITELDIHVFNTFPVKYLCRKNNPNRKHYMLNKCLKNKIIRGENVSFSSWI